MAAKTYLVHNGAAAGAAAPVKQATGAVVRTMMQIAPQGTPASPIRIIEWGISFDGSAAATPGNVELFACTAACTAMTAYAAADVQPYGDANAPANTATTTGVPLALGTALSGYNTAGGAAEVTPTAVRMFDPQLIPPTGEYVKQFPLGREPEVLGGQFLRVRVTFAATVNALCYVLFET